MAMGRFASRHFPVWELSDLDQTADSMETQTESCGNQIISVPPLVATSTTSSGKYSQSFCQQNIFMGNFSFKRTKILPTKQMLESGGTTTTDPSLNEIKKLSFGED